MQTRQYIFDFPVLNSHSTADFVIGNCNKMAARFIAHWPDWPGHCLIIAGPSGSGKTHLAKIFQDKSGAELFQAETLGRIKIGDLSGAVIIENAGPGLDEDALLHLFNWTRDNSGFLLVTASSPPAQWNLGLKDLASRLQGAQLASLGRPDEEILGAAMAKQFSDRQIAVEDKVIAYLLKRMDRSFPAVRRVVGEIDKLSLREKARVTVPLARKALKQLSGQDV